MLFLVLSLSLGHGHAGHGHSLPHGHAGNGGHATDQAAPHHTGSDNMSIWSFQMFFLFIGGFGIGGYFAALAHWSLLMTLLGGALGGLVLAALGYFIINLFYRRQSNSAIYSEEYIGLTGIVITSINAGSVGQVRCQIGNNRELFLARSVDGNLIPINSVVRITDIVGSMAVVEIADADGQNELPWRRGSL